MRLISWFRNMTGNQPVSNIIEFVKTRDVKSPNRGTVLSSGLDFYVPEDFQESIIKPGHSVLVPTGIHVKLNPEWTLIAFNKSGVAMKKAMLVGAQVIDADYQGEIHINLHNVGKDNQTVKPGDKLTQFILLKVSLAEPVELATLEALYEEESERGSGAFGSTDHK